MARARSGMSTPNDDNTLTGAEVHRLNTLEGIVQRALDTDGEAGNALADIRDARLYRGAHQTFEAYVRDRWGVGRSLTHQLIQSAGRAEPPAGDREIPISADVLPPGRAPVRRDDLEVRLTNAWERAR